MATHLDRNLSALRRHDAALARRIAEEPAVDAPRAPWPPLPQGPLLLVAPDADVLRAAAGRTAWLWDRVPGRLRAPLGDVDCAAAIREGRVRVLGDTAPLDTPLPEGMQVVVNPGLAARYRREIAWFGSKPSRRALVVDGGLVVEELSRALGAEGWGLWTWETTRLTPTELTRVARAVRPSWVVAVNHQPGLAEAVEALGDDFPDLRLRVWEIDPALDPVRPPTRPVPRTRIHTWRRGHVPIFQNAGYDAAWLPLGSDPTWRRPIALTPEEQAHVAAPVTFLGNSMLPEARRYQAALVTRVAKARAAAGLDAAQAAAVVAQVVAEQRRTPYQWRMPALLAAAVPNLTSAPGEADPAMLAGEIAAAELRLTVVANLGRFGVHVWGDEGWRAVERHGVRWRGPAGHRDLVPRIYGNGGIHVDIGRIYQLDIVTLRVFDVLACGGFLLAHHNDDVVRLFAPGVELDTWRTVEELQAKIAHYLPQPDLRRRIGEAGRARVLRDHTVQQRLATILGAPAGLS